MDIGSLGVYNGRREALVENIVSPFDDRRGSASFRWCWFVFLFYDVVAHPVADHAFYPLTSQNQHDCGRIGTYYLSSFPSSLWSRAK